MANHRIHFNSSGYPAGYPDIAEDDLFLKCLKKLECEHRCQKLEYHPEKCGTGNCPYLRDYKRSCGHTNRRPCKTGHRRNLPPCIFWFCEKIQKCGHRCQAVCADCDRTCVNQICENCQTNRDVEDVEKLNGEIKTTEQPQPPIEEITKDIEANKSYASLDICPEIKPCPDQNPDHEPATPSSPQQHFDGPFSPVAENPEAVETIQPAAAASNPDPEQNQEASYLLQTHEILRDASRSPSPPHLEPQNYSYEIPLDTQQNSPPRLKPEIDVGGIPDDSSIEAAPKPRKNSFKLKNDRSSRKRSHQREPKRGLVAAIKLLQETAKPLIGPPLSKQRRNVMDELQFREPEVRSVDQNHQLETPAFQELAELQQPNVQPVLDTGFVESGGMGMDLESIGGTEVIEDEAELGLLSSSDPDPELYYGIPPPRSPSPIMWIQPDFTHIHMEGNSLCCYVDGKGNYYKVENRSPK